MTITNMSHNENAFLVGRITTIEISPMQTTIQYVKEIKDDNGQQERAIVSFIFFFFNFLLLQS